MSVTVIHGDCRNVLAGCDEASVDAAVTDPPYEISFMSKKWDGSGIAYDASLWAEVLRVLKPGGHLLAFGGTRTYHRMACAIEDAGFEIRDSLHWVYGSGFPKSLDVSKAIDKMAGAEREVVRTVDSVGAFSRNGPHSAFRSAEVEPARTTVNITAPATDAARQWEGWGTALKPAHEPIVVARKPLVSTVAGNVLEHGTGALNIDGCRIAMGDEYDPTKVQRQQHSDGAIDGAFGASSLIGKEIPTYKPGGRWPANLVFTHAADCTDGCVAGCPVAELDGQSGIGVSRKGKPRKSAKPGHGYGMTNTGSEYDDIGGASRFFTVTDWNPTADVAPFRYVAKPSKKERNAGLDGLGAKREADRSKDDGAGGDNPRNRSNTAKVNHHPTVKPVALMRWLVRLVTPPNGVVLDPFAGSGTTLAAAVLEGFDAIGIELTDDYLPIIEGRVAWAETEASKAGNQLFVEKQP